MSVSTVYVGIDPGLDGAVACVDEDGRHPAVWDTPSDEVRRGKIRRRQYNIRAMADLIFTARSLGVEPDTAQQHRVIVGLEDVHAMPGQGVRSMFQMGLGVGLWQGIIGALGLPMHKIRPSRWRPFMVGAGTDKSAARLKACELFPEISGHFKRKRDHGRAEALLMAEYLRHKLRAGHKL